MDETEALNSVVRRKALGYSNEANLTCSVVSEAHGGGGRAADEAEGHEGDQEPAEVAEEVTCVGEHRQAGRVVPAHVLQHLQQGGEHHRSRRRDQEGRKRLIRETYRLMNIYRLTKKA